MIVGIPVTAFQLAQRFIGIREIPGAKDNPQVLAMLRLDQSWPTHDEVPWCSAFVNYIAWLLRLPRSKDLRSRSWLSVGVPIEIQAAQPSFDVVILNRGSAAGPEVLDAPGHVGFFAGNMQGRIAILGGNQGDSVSVAAFPSQDVLGMRRLLF
jgi:uncharacterized protein (TIGR02594 family)